jgi:hypothetical protein
MTRNRNHAAWILSAALAGTLLVGGGAAFWHAPTSIQIGDVSVTVLPIREWGISRGQLRVGHGQSMVVGNWVQLGFLDVTVYSR